MRQLGVQDRCLQRIEARIHPDLVRIARFVPAILAKTPDARRQLGIGRDHHAAIADRAEILGRIKAEAGDIAEAADPAAAIAGADGLGAVLDDPQIPCGGPIARSHPCRPAARKDEPR